jgi:hypothetical protein
MVVPHPPLVTSDETSLSVYPEPQITPRVGAEVYPVKYAFLSQNFGLLYPLFHGVNVPNFPRGVNTRSRRFITIVENTPRGVIKSPG